MNIFCSRTVVMFFPWGDRGELKKFLCLEGAKNKNPGSVLRAFIYGSHKSDFLLYRKFYMPTGMN